MEVGIINLICRHENGESSQIFVQGPLVTEQKRQDLHKNQLSQKPPSLIMMFSTHLPGVKGKFGLGVQNEAGQRLIEFCQENALVIENTLFQQHKRRLHMDICAAKNGDALHSLQKQDQELTVAQIMNSLLPNSDLNWRK